ncbi:hypothetical protein [Dictyobacter kobayashii]|uniref:Uncharacterized protein n=1 Tax=Dictyobacter kobayashii TaxID=2014872 RepID=A0A402ACE3_9CHLR|nr:hypothetical protein [Dictyobacter kobayashii]GCE16759.1 hypothetical protein KDK_05590 [Dictyobacter kobayashii]
MFNKKLLLPHSFGLSFTQSEVDFVIPDLTTDIPLCIDPFLLYRSKDALLSNQHQNLLAIFNQGIRYYREGKEKELAHLIDFPEANEISFGYSDRHSKGSGLGTQLNQLLSNTLSASEPLQVRGLRHIEELQLVSIGIGADRVSDIAANVLKEFLINYTQKQAKLWNIPLTPGLPISHYFDFESWEWSDGYFDLPKNPITGDPILLVPRRIVRRLPWINYDDFVNHELKMFLRPTPNKRMPTYPGMAKQEKLQIAKQEVVKLTRESLTLLDQYIRRKEKEGSQAEPLLTHEQAGDTTSNYQIGENFIARLNNLPSGRATANEYQRLIFEILNYLFEPELTMVN